MSLQNPEPHALRTLLARARRIAVLGFSSEPSRPSHRIARALQSVGYSIVPVRPGLDHGLGERAYPRLADIPQAATSVDIVNVFRAAEHVPGIVDECLALGMRVLWLQEGIRDEQAGLRAQAAGITVVMDRCIWRDYRALGVEREEAVR